jgi:DNA-binding HxlR family transcriptional regulator
MSKLCPKFEQAGNLIGKPWVTLIVFELLEGPKRFSELEMKLDITSRMLSERLKQLEEQDIVIRHVTPQTPVKIEYALSPKGYALKDVIHALESWSKTWYETI